VIDDMPNDSTITSQDETEVGAVGVNVTLPQVVFDAIAALIRDRPELSWDKALAQACALWVLQQGVGGNEINQAYLGAVFNT
jgi:hypothetical protein